MLLWWNEKNHVNCVPRLIIVSLILIWRTKWDDIMLDPFLKNNGKKLSLYFINLTVICLINWFISCTQHNSNIFFFFSNDDSSSVVVICVAVIGSVFAILIFAALVILYMKIYRSGLYKICYSTYLWIHIMRLQHSLKSEMCNVLYVSH